MIRKRGHRFSLATNPERVGAEIMLKHEILSGTLQTRSRQMKGRQMKTVKNIVLILCVCSLCSKAIVHIYRNFNPPPPPIVGP